VSFGTQVVKHKPTVTNDDSLQGCNQRDATGRDRASAKAISAPRDWRPGAAEEPPAGKTVGVAPLRQTEGVKHRRLVEAVEAQPRVLSPIQRGGSR